MACPYVCGPGHVFLGIGAQLVPLLLSLPSGSQSQQNVLRTVSSAAAGGPGTGAIFNGAGDIIGGTPTYPTPPPAAQLIQTFGVLNYLPLYLGTAEVTPRIEIHRGYAGWYDDEGGTTLPADDLYEGEEGLIVADINRWNEPAYAFVASIVNRLGAPSVRGFDAPQSVGSSLTYEGFRYPLWVQFPYAAKPEFALAGMPACYRFFSCNLLGPDVLEPLSHVPSRRRLVWRARRILSVVTGFAGLYDHDMINPLLPQVN